MNDYPKLLIFFLIFLALNVSPTHAESWKEQFGRYLEGSNYGDIIASAGIKAEKALNTGCADPVPTKRTLLAVVTEPSFQANSPHPMKGRWIDRVHINRCGTEVFQNVMFAADNGRMPKLGLLLPGKTIASPVLQRDATAIVLPSAGKLIPNCKTTEFKIVDTMFDVQVEPTKFDANNKVIGGAWEESWTVKGCNQQKDVVVTFESDGNGGTNIDVKASNVP